jgi:hypothetical protein
MKYEILKCRKIKKYNNKFYEFLLRNIHGDLLYCYYSKRYKSLIKDLLKNDDIETIKDYITFTKVPFMYLPDYDDITNGKYSSIDVIIYVDMDEEEFKELVEELLSTKPAEPAWHTHS